jgi:putative oxidoreductase
MDIALLVLRVVAGLFFAGHGAQKLFGKFGGHGLEGTAGFMESLGMKPGRRHAAAAGTAEFAGGLLLVLGLITPLAAAMIIAVMVVAIATVHAKNGPWVTDSGFEYNAVLIAIAFALAGAGPGEISVDDAIGWMPDITGTGWAFGALALGVLELLDPRLRVARELLHARILRDELGMPLDERVMLALEVLALPREALLALLQLLGPHLELRLALGGRATGGMSLLACDALALERLLELCPHRLELRHGALDDHVDRDGRRRGSRRLGVGCLSGALRPGAVLLALEQRAQPGAEALLCFVRRGHLNTDRMWSIAGPSTTMNMDGKMNMTVGKSILIGAFIAFSSAAA